MVVYDRFAQLDTLSSFDHTLAGAVSGVLTRVVSQPLDVLKIRFQLQVEPLRSAARFIWPSSTEPRKCNVHTSSAQSSKYTSIGQALRLIFAEEGGTALWKGHVPAQGLSLVFGVVQFVSFEQCERLAHLYAPDMSSAHSSTVSFLAGMASGSLAGTAALPLDVLRTRFVAQGKRKVYDSMWQAARDMYTKEGFQFMFYHLSVDVWNQFVRQIDEDELSSSEPRVTTKGFESLVCGGFAGTAAKLVVYPLDMLKKRLQMIGFEHARTGFGAVPKYNGLTHCVRMTLAQEGVAGACSTARTHALAGMFKGLTPSLLKAAVVSGVGFLVYEQVCNAIRRIRYRDR